MTKQIEGVKVEELTIGDEYLFEEILLRNKELTKHLIEKFISIPDIEDIEYISTEETNQNTHTNKGVRFDVYVKSQTGVAYIVELQRKDTKELEKRMRYYQAVSDSRQLPKGHPYKDLKDSYVILICREDIFGEGLYKYSFENTCLEIPSLKLNDGSYKIVLNAQGTKGDVCKDVIAFLKAIEGESSDNLFVKLFEAAAEKIKADEMWRETYMQSLLRDQDKFDAGEEKAKIEIVKSLLQDQLPIEFISKHTDLSVQEIEKLKVEYWN